MGAIPVTAEAAPWSLRSLRAASAITGTLSAKADRLNVLKADTSICCQQPQNYPTRSATEAEVSSIMERS